MEWNVLRYDFNERKIVNFNIFDSVRFSEYVEEMRKVLGFDKFPTVLVSPEAEDMLWDWLDGHN